MKILYDVAKIVRSKNAGPFSITLDVLFHTEREYRAVKEHALISKPVIASLYRIPEESITELVYFDQACGIKITYDRSVSSGTIGDRDVYGAQQHAPLMLLPVDERIFNETAGEGDYAEKQG